jgi:hypothetical protein
MKWKLKLLLAMAAAAVLAVCATDGAGADSEIIGDDLLEMLLCAPPLSAPGADSICRS